MTHSLSSSSSSAFLSKPVSRSLLARKVFIHAVTDSSFHAQFLLVSIVTSFSTHSFYCDPFFTCSLFLSWLLYKYFLLPLLHRSFYRDLFFSRTVAILTSFSHSVSAYRHIFLRTVAILNSFPPNFPENICSNIQTISYTLQNDATKMIKLRK